MLATLSQGSGSLSAPLNKQENYISSDINESVSQKEQEWLKRKLAGISNRHGGRFLRGHSLFSSLRYTKVAI